MIYVYFGVEKSFLIRELSKLIKDSLKDEVNEFTLQRFDAKETNIQDIVLAASEMPLGYDHKLVTCEDAYFLESEHKKEILKEQDYDSLLDYINHPNPDCDFVILVYKADLKKSGDVYKALIDNQAKFLGLQPIEKDDWPKYCENYFKKRNFPIEHSAVIELANRTSCNRYLFINEAEKLMLYSDNIKLTDVVNFVNKPLEENTFLLSNALLKGDIASAFSIYSDLKVQNVEPITLNNMLANQFRFMSEVDFLNRRGYSETEIAKELKISSPYRVKIALKNLKLIKKGQLPNIIDECFENDFKIKSGQVDRFVVFELFILNFKDKYLAN